MNENELITSLLRRGICVDYQPPLKPRDAYYCELYSVGRRQRSKQAFDGTESARLAALRVCFNDFEDGTATEIDEQPSVEDLI